MASISEAQPDLSLDQEWTELERLMVAWADLNTKGRTGTFIAYLVHKKIQHLKLHYTHQNPFISLENVRRLLEIHKSISSMGGVEVANRAGIDLFLADKFVQRLDSHHSRLKSDAPPRSTLELFEGLEFWLAVESLLETHSFALGEAVMDRITNVVSYDVAACPTDVVAIPGSLRVVEIGAKLMRALPQQYHPQILQAVNSHIIGLAIADSNLSSSHGLSSGKPSVVHIGDGEVAQVRAQASRELIAADNAHATVTAAFQTQIQLLQEQAVENEATISGLNREKDFWTQENVDLEDRVHDMTQELSGIQSLDPQLQEENLELQSEMAELRSETAGLKKNFKHSKSKYQGRIRKLKDEVGVLRQALLDHKSALDTDGQIYDESFQARAEKLTEELAEAIDDKAALARDYDKLFTEKTKAEVSLAKSEDRRAAMSNEIHELITARDRLEQDLKDVNDNLEDAEDDRAMLLRNVEKLTSEQARLEKELSDAKDILYRISSFSASIRPRATHFASQVANTNTKEDTDTGTGPMEMLTPPSSTQTTPR